MIEHDYSMKKIDVQQIWDDIFALNPGLRDNPYARFAYREFREAEDQDERVPAISAGMMRHPVGVIVSNVKAEKEPGHANFTRIGEQEIWAMFHRIPQIFILKR